jgi:hypothetical protein
MLQKRIDNQLVLFGYVCKRKKIQKVVWLEIQYKGLVKSKRKKLIIITINNEQFVMGVGDENFDRKICIIIY